MADDKKRDAPKPLTLSKSTVTKSSRDEVVQSFSHGRSKSVAVEFRKRRRSGKVETGVASGKSQQEEAGEAGLSASEQKTRIDALKRARETKDDQLLKDLPPVNELPPPPPVKAEEVTAPKKISEQRDSVKKGHGHFKPETKPTTKKTAPEEDDWGGGHHKKTLKKTKRGEATRHHDHESNLARSYIAEDTEESPASAVGRLSASGRPRRKHKALRGTVQKLAREISLPVRISVKDLAHAMSEKAAEVLKKLMGMGIVATINQEIDSETAELIAIEMGHKVKSREVEELRIPELEDVDGGDLESRPPIVTVMGHVDHGKTSLLDTLRKTNVTAQESGGITQHIGAYQVTLSNGKRITFIDTPGHAAFTEMRARGTNVTDIVVLLVAADDGVKEQTVEAIHHAKAAQVPMVVAINKIDKPGADIGRAREMLLSHDIVVEELGGDVLSVPVSALKGENLDKLEEAILLQAELLELKANPKRPAVGVVLEARLDRERGSVATIVIEKGTLKRGDIFVVGQTWGRVRALINDQGKVVSEAGPSQPIEVLGFDETPAAGDDFFVVENDARARDIADQRKGQRESKQDQAPLSLETLLAQHTELEQQKRLPFILKGDTQGSVEAILGSIGKIKHDEVAFKTLYSSVGGITENDVVLAKASGGIIIGFNVRASASALQTAKKHGVTILYYSVIYDLLNDLKGRLSNLLSPDKQEKALGTAEVRQVFNITKVGRVAGCYVSEGLIRRAENARLVRDQVVIFEGIIKTLRRQKDEAKEVRSGYECGIMLDYSDIQVGDLIECFTVEYIKRSIEDKADIGSSNNYRTR